MRLIENRIPPPIVFLFSAVVMWAASFYLPAFPLDPPLRYALTVAFLILGLVGPLGIREFAKARTTINPVDIEAASSLVTTGVFALTRNPMYLAMTSLLLALAAYLSVPWLLLGPALFVLFITRFQIVPEERVMRTKFGDGFRAYQSRVPRWL